MNTNLYPVITSSSCNGSIARSSLQNPSNPKHVPCNIDSNLYQVYNEITNSFDKHPDIYQYEKDFYEKTFKEALKTFNRNLSRRGLAPINIQTFKEKYPPLETTFQIGTKDCPIYVPTFIKTVATFQRFFDLHILSKNKKEARIIPLTLAYHFDEEAPHIHLRCLFLYDNGAYIDNCIEDVVKILGFNSIKDYNNYIRKLFIQAAILNCIDVNPAPSDEEISMKFLEVNLPKANHALEMYNRRVNTLKSFKEERK